MSGEFAGPLLTIPLPIIPLTQFGGFLCGLAFFCGYFAEQVELLVLVY